MSPAIGLWEPENVNIETFLYREPVKQAQNIPKPYHALEYDIIQRIMDKQTISFRLEIEKVAELDELAGSMDRDRTYLLNQAVQAYLDLQKWQLDEIRAGLADADAGRVVDHGKMRATVAKWRKRK
ncbi:MAG: CopG family ribbon-helix-helix protein [Candidatus Sulfotelmatobacter sp.]